MIGWYGSEEEDDNERNLEILRKMIMKRFGNLGIIYS